MIMTVDELRYHYDTNETDEQLYRKLNAVEQRIRNITHNEFHVKNFNQNVLLFSDGHIEASNGTLLPFNAGDTVQLKGSHLNDGLFTVRRVTDDYVYLNESVVCADAGMLYLVKYPEDVMLGCVNMVMYESERRDAEGISSETISRHQVTYTGTDAGNTEGGYPKSVVAFLSDYKRARFGRG